LYDRLAAAEDPNQDFGIRDADRQYFQAPGQRRWLFWKESVFMEFRSQILVRYAVVGPARRTRYRQRRWDHPLSMWLLPLELMRRLEWQPIEVSEFEKVWHAIL